MTPPELPDDYREWPTDPFALLGVERGADATTIRRAYTQLIRKYKPEHHPEEFCRIREAYDTCREQAAWYRREPDAESSGESPSALPRWSAPVVEQQPSEADRLWADAVAGNLAAAYAGLVPLAVDSADVALRLYWLLAMEPRLDPKRSRHAWLHAALTQSRLGSASLELYRRELEAEPSLALAEPFAELLAAEAEWSQLIQVAQMRIAACGRTGQLWLVEADLKHVKTRLGIDNDVEWLNLVVTALDWAAWDQSNTVAAFCLDELPRLKHLELNHGYQFDRVDQALYWGGEAAAAGQPHLMEFFHLLGQVWASAGPVEREDIVRGVAAIAAQPTRAMGWFDTLFQARGPNLGILATRLLGRYCFDLEPSHPPDLLRGYVRGVAGIRKDSWSALRLRLLDVLIRLRLHPEELAAACAADPEPRFRDVAAALRGDLSLELAWLAACLSPPKAAA